ncbi:MAG: alpha/beta hydrolase [Gammaproteobacteria bacterium]|nr:alpha/beta hydrolase [Gammaproteobacteria bacterium]
MPGLCTRNLLSTLLLAAGFAGSVCADDSAVLSVDHYVIHASSAPSIAGQMTEVYVRERATPGTIARSENLGDRVVLFVHGAGTPAEVAFDVPYADYSWMAFLAGAGYDVFAMDMTGYGRSHRPPVMNDRCNLAAEQQSLLGMAKTCKAPYTRQTTTIASDWDDIDAVVDYLRKLRNVDRVSLVGWSLGGPRAGGYAARHPEKVNKLILLAPAYSRDRAEAAPADLPATGDAMNVQSLGTFAANWERQLGCRDQYDAQAAAAVWSAMLASDPVGATWGPGVRRAPGTTVWGFGPQAVKKITAPTLLFAGVYDAQVPPARVAEMYEDMAVGERVMVELGCASHNAMWETDHLLLFRATLEWLQQGTVSGMTQGRLRMGD